MVLYLSCLKQDFFTSDWILPKFGLVSLRWINKKSLIWFVTRILIILLLLLHCTYTQNMCFHSIFASWCRNLEQISCLDRNWKKVFVRQMGRQVETVWFISHSPWVSQSVCIHLDRYTKASFGKSHLIIMELWEKYKYKYKTQLKSVLCLITEMLEM